MNAQCCLSSVACLLLAGCCICTNLGLLICTSRKNRRSITERIYSLPTTYDTEGATLIIEVVSLCFNHLLEKNMYLCRHTGVSNTFTSMNGSKKQINNSKLTYFPLHMKSYWSFKLCLCADKKAILYQTWPQNVRGRPYIISVSIEELLE